MGNEPIQDVGSGDALMAFDEQLTVVAWNAAAEELTGIPPTEAIGRPCWEMLGGRDRDGATICHAGCSAARLLREGRTVRSRELHVRARGGRRCVDLATVTVRQRDRPLFLHLLRPRTASEPPNGSAPRLTARQREVLRYLADGVPAKVIALRLGLAETTVRNHISELRSRLDSRSQLEAVATARRLGIIAP